MANSCNSYFSHIYRLAVDNPAYGNVKDGYIHWKKFANSFGMGVKLGVDLPSEDKGIIADTGWYNRTYNGAWNSCTNVFLGIGQGEMTATPLQMANLMCIIANKGYYYTPHFVDSIDGRGEGDTILSPFKVKHEVTRIPDEEYEEVQLGMQDVVDRGTASVARLQGISVAAKTGTAENYGNINGKREKLEDHSWFVCFAPRENPKIAIAVIVENAGFGATWAGPIAALMMEKYLNDTLRTERLKEVERIAAKEIILPVVKQKRMRLDSIRRVRLALEMGDSSALHNALPSAPEKPEIDVNIRKDKALPPIKNSLMPARDTPAPAPKNNDTIKAVAILRKDEGTES
jgi:penicillin-binding protein 2